jgi:hypothetical protein
MIGFAIWTARGNVLALRAKWILVKPSRFRSGQIVGLIGCIVYLFEFTVI